MNTRIFAFFAALCLLQVALADVPNAISYQGRALTASGAPMGAGTPITRTVTFRIWGSASNSLFSDLLYSEQQVVTLAEGEFSVLIGQGRATVGTPLGYSETLKGPPELQVNTVFTSASCYLGVTIDDGTAAVDNEVSPRQQLASSAYVLRAKVADGLASQAATTAMLADGAVGTSQVADGAVTLGKLASGAVTATQLADVTITSTKFATGAVTSAAIADGSVTAIKIADATITPANLAYDAVTSAAILDGTIATADLADGAVTAAKIADGSITAAKIADGSITAAKLGAGIPAGMAYIPGGTYTQGNSIGDTDITDAVPVTTTVSPFYMDVNLVSFSVWQKVYYWATANGYDITNAGLGRFPNHPVHTISWYDMVKWCNARSQQEGLTPVYYTDTAQTTVYKTGYVDVSNAMVKWTANGYRLPTEAEWERAARGGLSGQRFPWGNTASNNLANYTGYVSGYDAGPAGYSPMANQAAGPYTSPVGSYAPNGYGLYDMAGNIWQLCWDWYFSTLSGGSDPRGTTTETWRRSFRGGHAGNGAYHCRTAFRSYVQPGFASQSFSFRTVRSIP
jgi:formylglycine-generating enzyme required for sulfatase activity